MSKTKQIIFRLSEEDYSRIEKIAGASGKNPNDWCRDLANLGEDSNDPTPHLVSEPIDDVCGVWQRNREAADYRAGR